MAGYALRVNSSEGNFELGTATTNGKSIITSVKFKMNTMDDATLNRSDAVRAELRITGVITNDSRDLTKNLATWAIDDNLSTLYRNVEIDVNQADNNTGEIIRRYNIDNMFVVDYEESTSNKDVGTFELFLAQKEGKYKIEVFSK